MVSSFLHFGVSASHKLAIIQKDRPSVDGNNSNTVTEPTTVVMFFDEFQEWGPYVSRDDDIKLKELRPATEQPAPPQLLQLHPSLASGEPTSPNSLAGDSGAHNSPVEHTKSQASVPPTQITTESTPAGTISQVMPLPLTSLSSTV